jgi:competence ComEA-like helix-hairpin-helix protein
MTRWSDWSWTISQRRALIVIFSAAAFVLTVQAIRRPVFVPLVLPAHEMEASDLQDKLDPNTASAAMLSTLPRLGVKKAQAIVDYRQRFSLTHAGQPAFSDAGDLMRIKGIGPATVEKLSPYLVFSPGVETASPQGKK